MVLTPRTIEALVAALRRKDSEASIFAIESKSPWNGPDEIVAGDRRMRVRDVRSALRLREVLREPRDGRGLVILTDLDHSSFGRENLAKAALRRIESVQPWPVVRLVFGVASIDPRLVRHTWMAERLLQAPSAERTIAGGALDLETAWSIVLSSFGLRSARPSEEEFLEAATKPAFAQAFRELPAEGREEFKRVVQDVLDRLGTTLLAVVERGLGDQLLAAGLVAQCIFEVHDAQALRVRGAFSERFGVRGLDAVVACRWGGVARRLLLLPDYAALVSRVRAQADAILVGDLDAGSLAYASDDLPSGLTQRVRAVADLVLAAVERGASEQDLSELRDAVRRVEQHATALSHGDAERAAMAARLVRWLALPRSAASGLEAAIRRYADDESWVDRARVSLREGESVPEARRAYQALAECVARQRAALNAAVAAAAIDASLPQGGLMGVEHVLDRVVAPLAKERPVALIVMDGMSHPVAHDLVRSLEEVAWTRYRPRSQPVAPLVLSTVPTVTEFARTSLLCGALRAGGQKAEQEGFESFLKSRSLGGSRHAKVFHKAMLDTSSNEVEEALASDAKVVACVINAIDAQLGGSDQLRTQWSLRSIPVLARLARACEVSGRAMVLVSDHGHLLDESTQQLSATGVGQLLPSARWRGADGTVRPGELHARGPRVMAPDGECVVASDERVRYCNPHAGYHGGVTVQELACPLNVLIHTSCDSGLSEWVPVEPTTPAWWHADSAPAPCPAPTQVPTRPRSRARDGGAAGGLFTPGPEGWIARLFKSETYAAQRKIAGRAPLPDDFARRMIEVFVESGPSGSGKFTLTEQAVAARLELSVTDTRKRVTLLRNLLNVEGYSVLAQPDRDSLELDIELLRTQFALDGGEA